MTPTIPESVVEVWSKMVQKDRQAFDELLIRYKKNISSHSSKKKAQSKLKSVALYMLHSSILTKLFFYFQREKKRGWK